MESRYGQFYFSFGSGVERSWEYAVEFGLNCAGAGAWYSRTLNLLNPADRVWVNVPKRGYVGVGIVAARVETAKDFHVIAASGERVPTLQAETRGKYHRQYADGQECQNTLWPFSGCTPSPLKLLCKSLACLGTKTHCASDCH